MKHHLKSTASLRPRSAAAWCLWAMRWTLVLLLVADQIGAPLHRHHHDSGVDALRFAVADDNDHGVDAHAEELDHTDGFGHATLAVRPSSETKTFAAANGNDADPITVAVITAAWASILFADPQEAGLRQPFDRWRSPTLPVYRSLPPGGRAPPLHA